MELHLAIKQVIETDGENIVKEPRLVNILSDFQAYDSIPASKYILRAIVADGYAECMLSIGSWNTKCLALVEKFVNETGFHAEYADLIFQSIAFGLGWKKEVETKNAQSNNPITSSSSSKLTTSNPQQSNKPWAKMTAEEKECHVLSLLEWNITIPEIEAKSGLILDNFSVDIKSASSFYINYEVSGKLKKSARMNLQYAIYNKKNKVVDKDFFMFYYSANYKGFHVERRPFNRRISDISKILIFEG